MNFKSFVLLAVVSMLASPLCHAQVEVRPVGITINSAETLYNKTLDGATTVFNGSSTQNFSVATLTVNGSINAMSNSGVRAESSAGGARIGTAGFYLTFVFEEEKMDHVGEYSPSTGIFTAQQQGGYLFCWHIQTADMDVASGSYIISRVVVSSPSCAYSGYAGSSGVNNSSYGLETSGSIALSMGAGATAKIETMTGFSSVNSYASGQYCWLTITKIW